MKRIISALTVTLSLWASTPALAGPFEKFFQPAAPGTDAYVTPAQAEPRIVITNDLQGETRRLLEEGYLIVGVSAFTGAPQDPKKAKRQGKKIKAELILYASSFESTRSGAVPLMMPNNTTTTVTGNVYGSGGWAGVNGTINSYRTTPVIVPYSVDRYNQEAVYFSKMKEDKIGIGLGFKPLDTRMAKIIGTNKAIMVEYVIRHSPAFKADLFSGDIILTVAGRDVSSEELMAQVKADFSGKTVPIDIIRDGEPKTLEITIPVVTAQTTGK